CIYPKLAPQPMAEECLLTSALEPTNEAYAIAKIAGLKLAQFYRKQYGVCFHSAMPTNLYGPGDNYHPQNSHVLPALIRRIHEAKKTGAPEVVAWGTGAPRREFLYVDDFAVAVAANVLVLRRQNRRDLRFPPETLSFPGLMPEMAHTGENHRDVVFVSRGDHFIVADGAAWLNRAGRASVGGGD